MGRVTRAGTYSLIDTAGNVLSRRPPADQLKLISTPSVPDQKAFYVEKILDHKGDSGNRYYLVKWKYFSVDQNSWEPLKNFDDTTQIRLYWKRKDDRKKNRKESLSAQGQASFITNIT